MRMRLGLGGTIRSTRGGGWGVAVNPSEIRQMKPRSAEKCASLPFSQARLFSKCARITPTGGRAPGRARKRMRRICELNWQSHCPERYAVARSRVRRACKEYMLSSELVPLRCCLRAM